MGAPSRLRTRISKPSHPWQGERIEEEKALIKEYGFRNKREIWKMSSLLRNFFNQTKSMIASTSSQSEKEKIQLLKKLSNLGITEENTKLEDVLGLSIRDILERRLQSIVFRKGMARSMKQARQFITHEHILVNGKKITAPSYLVPKALENTITFSVNSSLNDEMHPERKQEEKLPKKPKVEEKPAKAEKSEAKAEEKSKKKEKAKPVKEKKEDKKEAKEEKKKVKKEPKAE